MAQWEWEWDHWDVCGFFGVKKCRVCGFGFGFGFGCLGWVVGMGVVWVVGRVDGCDFGDGGWR